MSISDGLDPYFSRRKTEKTRSLKDEKDGEVLFSRQSRLFSFIDNMIKVPFPIFTLNWRVNNYVFAKEKIQIGETKVLLLSYNFLAFGTVLSFLKMLTVCFDRSFSLLIRGDICFGFRNFIIKRLCYNRLCYVKNRVQSLQLTELFPQNHGNFEE